MPLDRRVASQGVRKARTAVEEAEAELKAAELGSDAEAIERATTEYVEAQNRLTQAIADFGEAGPA